MTLRFRKGFSLDHVVIVVNDLTEAIENFQSIGFTVQRGGTTGPVENALICFQDGTYIELISMHSRVLRILTRLMYLLGILFILEKLTPALKWRFMFWFGAGEGIRDWCIRCDEMAVLTTELKSKGFLLTDIERFKRLKPDQTAAEWYLMAAKDRRLPFLIEDITPLQVRVPINASSNHANGTLGIASIVLGKQSSNRNRHWLKVFCKGEAGKPQAHDVKSKIKFSERTNAYLLELIGEGKAQTLPMTLISKARVQLIEN